MGTGRNPGKLFVLSGPSGAGKGTICQALLARTENLALSVSMTTRAPRAGEMDGVSYYFVSEERFLAEARNGGLLEYANVYGHYYGTPLTPVLEKLQQGLDVILEIDIQGALQIRESYPAGVFIFILPPSLAELRKRLTGRGTEDEATIARRLGEALHELSFIDRYDYCVVNGTVEEATARVQAILVAEHSRVACTPEELIARYEEEI